MGDEGGESKRPDTRTEPEVVFERLFRNGRTNAFIAWGLVGILLLVLVESVLSFDRLWILFVAVTGIIAGIPPAAHRDWRVMLPWELLVIALLPILTRGLFGGELGTFATYLAIAGLALLITVELHMFTALQVTHWFAIVFVVMTTLAAAAGWTIIRWSTDRVLGTAFLSSNGALMHEFVWVTLAGLAGGVLFDAYFKRRGRRLGGLIQRVIGR